MIPKRFRKYLEEQKDFRQGSVRRVKSSEENQMKRMMVRMMLRPMAPNPE